MAVYQNSNGRELKVINVQMFEKDKEKLKQICRDRGITQAELIEQMLKEFR